MKVKKGDTVLIIQGKDRTKTGKILGVYANEDKIIVEGINLKKKHVKPKRQGEKGQIVQIPAKLDVSNVKIICSKCAKATKIGYKVEKDKKYRICKKCNQEI